MAGYIITTILLIIVLSIQGSKQNFALWKFIVVASLLFIIMYDIKSILNIYTEEYMFIIWVGTIILTCLGMLILLIGEEKNFINSVKDKGINI